MDYEAIDRDMSSWVVACDHNNTRFYITDEDLASDMLSRAKRFRWSDQAFDAADKATSDPAWAGFRWEPSLVAAEMAR